MAQNKIKQQYLECGRAVSTHGVSGNLRVECWCDSASVLASLKTLYTKKADLYIPHKVIKSSVQKQMVLVNLSDVNTLEGAIAMKGTVLYADRNELSELLNAGDIFIADLIGLSVIDIDTGFVYGVLSDVKDIGVHDLYIISRPIEYKDIQPEAMIPAVEEFVKKIDMDEGIFIRPIDGFFEKLPGESLPDGGSPDLGGDS